MCVTAVNEINNRPVFRAFASQLEIITGKFVNDRRAIRCDTRASNYRNAVRRGGDSPNLSNIGLARHHDEIDINRRMAQGKKLSQASEIKSILDICLNKGQSKLLHLHSGPGIETLFSLLRSKSPGKISSKSQ